MTSSSNTNCLVFQPSTPFYLFPSHGNLYKGVHDSVDLSLVKFLLSYYLQPQLISQHGEISYGGTPRRTRELKMLKRKLFHRLKKQNFLQL